MIFAELLLLNTFVVLLLFIFTLVFFYFFRTVERSKLPDDQLPFVSIIVPVRNEAGKIARCLDSLSKQDYPRFEVIVVDDRSTDDSAEIISRYVSERPNLKTVTCPEVRPGWLGKCNALAYGSNLARGDWFAFVDADTYHHANSLRDGVSSAISNGVDLISFMPVQELYSFSERVVMPVLLGSFLLGDPFNRINDVNSPRAYAYGQYFILKRKTYEAIGGHERVRDQILDDIALGRAVKAHGFRITAADGRRLYSVRMYTNLAELWSGWTKNLYALIDCNPVFLFGVLILLNIAFVAPYASLVYLLTLIAKDPAQPGVFLASGLLLSQFSLTLIWYWRTSLHYKGVRLWHMTYLPAGSILLTMLYLYSAFCVVSGSKVNWKDRKYGVNTGMKIRSEADVLVK